jgi:hypothetical protein
MWKPADKVLDGFTSAYSRLRYWWKSFVLPQHIHALDTGGRADVYVEPGVKKDETGVTYGEIRHRSKVFHIQKAGNSAEEYEDVFRFSEDNSLFALADGVSDSVFSGKWATILVDAFVNNPFDIEKNGEAFVKWLEPLQEQWQTKIDWSNLRWYMEEKAKRGAFSTFLAVRITTAIESGKTIHSVAIGDTCLFLISDNKLIAAYPIENPSDFNNKPPLLCSYERYNDVVSQHLNPFSKPISKGDSIVMATDAFAKWFLQETQNGNQPWTSFENIDQAEFEEVIGSLRKSNKITNDDTTAAFIYIE